VVNEKSVRYVPLVKGDPEYFQISSNALRAMIAQIRYYTDAGGLVLKRIADFERYLDLLREKQEQD